MKKLLSLFLVLTLLLTFASCGKTKTTNGDDTTTTASATENTNENITEHTTNGETTSVNETTTEKVTEEEGTTKVENSTTTTTTTTQKEEITKKNNTTTTTKPKETTTKKAETTTKKPSKPSTTTTTTTNSVSQVSVVTNDDIVKIKNGFLRLVNEERVRMGRGTLKTNSILTKAANTRSQEIITKISHTRPNEKPFYTVWDSNEYPHYGVGENIQCTSHMGNQSFTREDLFVGRDDQIVAAYTTIFNNFKNSVGHYENMLYESYIETGIGISYKIDSATGMAVFYVVQIFGSGY